MALSGQQQPKADQAHMSKREESKYKINRRLGVNLWGRAKSPLNRREYGPGQHGQRRKKPSDYGTQLAAKQKLRSEEHTSELQSLAYLVCRLLLEKKRNMNRYLH